jgi:hypothetical protein
MPKFAVFLAPLLALTAFPQTPHLTAPKEALGFHVGDDYQMASYAQLESWWKKLAAESDRIKLADIGLTAEGRHQFMAIISSPANLKNLDHYRQISRRLALAENLSDDEAHKLAAEGKAVVWIDGGLHATETVGSQQLMEWVWQMVSRTDPETLRFLNDVILLAVPANPDGQDLVAQWYMRNSDPKRRSLTGLPHLYEKYAGHDDNRDFYMSNLPETVNMNRILYREWSPQIMYDHHQTGPRGGVVFIPPFRDPFNYHFDPLIPPQIEQLGSAMHSRLIAEGKYGSGMRSVSTYSTWYNGGLRTTTYFHNMIGLLTEIIGSPTPIHIPLVPERQLPTGDLPAPVAPQEWHYRQSIDYEMTENRAVMDYASRYRETLLYNVYRMGRNSIERGSTDSWTITPKRLAALLEAARNSKAEVNDDAGGGADNFTTAETPRNVSPELFQAVLHKPEFRDPRAYILPSDQPDFPTATKFVNILINCGITVHRATSPFNVAGKSYPAGSYVVKSAQAFRPHVLDMFEPQDHPNDFRYPGGPPIPPYDATGYTPAFLMGIQFDRILDGFDGPFEKLDAEVKTPAGTITGPPDPAGYLLSHRVNDSFILVNRLLKEGCDVYWLKSGVKAGGQELETGAIWIPASAAARSVLDSGTKELGVNAQALPRIPAGSALKLKPARIGLVDVYGGSMPSGWVRYLFERFEFPFQVVFPKTLDEGNLAAHYDALVFMDGAMRSPAGMRRGTTSVQPRPESIPEEDRDLLGRVTPEKTVPQIRKFIEAGGDVVTVGGSTGLAELLGLPVKNALTEHGPDGAEHALPREKFYVPGAVLRAAVDTNNPLAYGFNGTVDVFFDSDPVYKLAPDAASKGISPVAWFAGPEPLRSGWAWGQQYLDGGVAIAEADVGEGKLFLLGPEVTFRAQPHGTFKFLFNAIDYGTSKPVLLGPVSLGR